MATPATSTSRRGLALAVATAAAVAAGAAWFATGEDEAGAGQPKPFWSLISWQGDESNLPADVSDIVKRSDAVVLAHVSGVVDGREMKGFSDATPPNPAIPRPRSVFVQLTVDEVVKGAVTGSQVLNLEMPAPPEPLTIDTVRDGMPPGQMLFFLWNNAALAKRSGFTSATIQQREKDVWQTVGTTGIVAQNPNGLYKPLLPEDPSTTPFLQSFGAATVQQAAEKAKTVR